MINVIVDQNDLGDALSSHADVAKVAFTGSTATGKKVMGSAADTLKRLTLELGGNDAAIVLDDVDPIEVAPKVFAAAMMNAGQVCLGAKRIYVHESQYDQICDELGRLARESVVDDGLKQGTQMGPLQNKAQFEKVKGFLEDAKRNGKIVAGGEVLNRKGYFIQPTIVRDIPDDARLVTEEQFGPIVPVLRYSDIDDAIARANNRTMDSAERYGRRISIGRSGWPPRSKPVLSGSTSFSTCHPIFLLVAPSNQVSAPNWVRKGSKHSPRPRSSTWRSSARRSAGRAMIRSSHAPRGQHCSGPKPTGRMSTWRARARPRSGEPEPAIDSEYLTCHPFGVAGLARLTIQRATSSGLPRRLSGICSRSCSSMAAACSGERPIMPVRAPDSVGPAATAFTRTPFGSKLGAPSNASSDPTPPCSRHSEIAKLRPCGQRCWRH